MRESDAKTRLCPHMLLSMKIGIMGIGLVPEISQQEYAESLDLVANLKMENCQGSKCMMWQNTDSMDHKSGYCGLTNK